MAANLIVGLPGETCEDLEVTRENLVSLDHLLGVESLNFSNFTLDHGSWYLDDPGRHGLSNVRPGRFHHLRFPGPEAAEMVPLDYAFDLNTSAREREELASRWEGVMQLVESNETDQQRKLVQVHGGDWIDILDLRRHQPEPYTYRLRGDQAEIYRYCHISRPLRRVHRRFPHVAAASIDRFLDDLEGKRLIYKDGDGCISLALARDSHRALRQYQDLLRANDEAVETQTAKT